MGLSIHLLGQPRMELAGTPMEDPRGHKAWGLLAYLLRSRVPPSRERVASLLFPEADDPLGALRWTLSALRRRLGEEAELGGDPLRLTLPPGTFVDVDVLSRGSWIEAIALPGLGHGLLDGLVFRSSPGFEMWLESERRHVAGTTSAVLHQAALALLGARRGGRRGASRRGARRAQPLRGERPCPARPLPACRRRFRGLQRVTSRHAPSSSDASWASSRLLRFAPRLPPPRWRLRARVSGRAAVRAQVEAGEAALAAGAVEAGLHRLRGAVAAARSVDDRELLSRALVALGGALVHSARGTDEEGAAALHEGTTLAEQVGRFDVAATGWREISWVQFLRAHYERAEESLTHTAELAAGNDEELAWVDADSGRLPARRRGLRGGRRAAALGARAREATGLRPAVGSGAHPAGPLPPPAGRDRGRGPPPRPGPRGGRGARHDRVRAVAGVVSRRGRPHPRRRRFGGSTLRARVRPRLPGRRSVLGEHRSAGARTHRGGARRRSSRARDARRRAEAVPPPARHVPLDRGVRARRALRRRRRTPTREPPGGGSTSWRRSPRAGGSASSSCGRPSTELVSENPAHSTSPARSPRRSTIQHSTSCSCPQSPASSPADGVASGRGNIDSRRSLRDGRAFAFVVQFVRAIFRDSGPPRAYGDRTERNPPVRDRRWSGHEAGIG